MTGNIERKRASLKTEPWHYGNCNDLEEGEELEKNWERMSKATKNNLETVWVIKWTQFFMKERVSKYDRCCWKWGLSNYWDMCLELTIEREGVTVTWAVTQMPGVRILLE